MKSVLISIQPYWVFLIIARTMGWKVEKEKTVEVRKSFPKDEDWDKTAKIYCSKDKKSFLKIPQEYQFFIEQFLGKVIGEFVCDEILGFNYGIQEPDDATSWQDCYKGYPEALYDLEGTCLTVKEINDYGNGRFLYTWHISDLVIYDKPMELDYFRKPIECHRGKQRENCKGCWDCEITRPPQSWCYVEEVQI